MYVGEGEALLRDTFSRARQAAPAVLLLDEADALAPAREAGSSSSSSSGGGGGPEPGVRLLSTLLTELDGLEAGGAGGAGGWLVARGAGKEGADYTVLFGTVSDACKFGSERGGESEHG
jgi:SpoVK/Ycf46/Vps4 family AAA+-type ATPase